MTIMTMMEQLDAYRALLDKKEQLAEAVKENNRAIEGRPGRPGGQHGQRGNGADRPGRVQLHPDPPRPSTARRPARMRP